MLAGRELDALIAEKVMGHIISEDRVFAQTYGFTDPRVETSQDRMLRRVLANYSTDISAAWGVVEKIGLNIILESESNIESNEAWCCNFWNYSTDRIRARGQSAPHAICLAALEAVGVEV